MPAMTDKPFSAVDQKELGRSGADVQFLTADDLLKALIADLAKFDAEISCEACGAPLFDGDDFVGDPDGVYGCWSAMTNLPSKQERPCYAYRVGKAGAASPSPSIADQGGKL